VEYIEFLSNRAKLEPLEDIAKGILHTHCENEQQADFLSLAKAEMDTLQTENIELRKLLKEAFPLLHSRADSESLGPKSLVTRIFDIALKEQ